jgi:hypothetical protein
MSQGCQPFVFFMFARTSFYSAEPSSSFVFCSLLSQLCSDLPIAFEINQGNPESSILC